MMLKVPHYLISTDSVPFPVSAHLICSERGETPGNGSWHRKSCVALRSFSVDSYQTYLAEDDKRVRRSSKEHTSLLDITEEGSNFGDHFLRVNDADGTVRLDALGRRNIDITTLGNLCVDIVLNVPSLPPSSFQGKLAYMNQLAESSPHERYWEAGGNSNTAIAAARLGLHCVALGHVGHEKYGSFLHKVLEDEGVQVARLEDTKEYEEQEHEIGSDETLLCWVLVDPNHRHGFCSRFDFNKDPAFSWIRKIPSSAKAIIQKSKVLYCNGFLFDELSPEVIASTVEFAYKSGCAVFFDPGPRAMSLSRGSIGQQQTLNKLLKFSDVLLLTADEAEALTKITDPILSAMQLLERGQCTKWVIIKMGRKGCLMATAHGTYQVPAFKVDVVDTVGCGDSFAAAIALGYTHGLPVASTLALANAVGAATAMGCGAGRNVATLDNVMKILRSSEQEDETGQVFSQIDSTIVRMTGLHSDLYLTGEGSHLSIRSPIQTVSREALGFLINSMWSGSEFSAAPVDVSNDTHPYSAEQPI